MTEVEIAIAVAGHPLDGIEEGPWLYEVEHLDPLSCSRQDLESLVQAAPTSQATAWLIGILEARVRLAFIMGVPF